jgi:hypothetical protein
VEAVAEPYRPRCWRLPSPLDSFRFFTCARPGRSKGADRPVGDDLVDRWVRGLPREGASVIVSLLGRKHGPNGLSEFSFYSFCGGFDSPSERGRRPSFQEWLDRRHKNRSILVVEHPTYDFCAVSQETLDAVAADILAFLREGRAVVLIDSGGETRIKQVCKFMHAIEDSARPE